MPGKILYALVAGAVAASFIGATGASAKELIYGAGVPARGDQMTMGMKTYADDLAKATNGSLTLKIVAGSQIVTLYNTLAGLRDGVIDAGFVVPTFTRKELKHVNVIYDTEVFGTDPAAITGAANETILLHCPSCMDDFKANRAVYLGSFGNNDKGLICREEIKTVAEVRGLKVRAVGATTRLIAAMGGVPVVMGPPDATTALERGTIDCVHAVLTWFKNFGYWDVAKYMLEAPLGSPRTISDIVFGRRAWDAMSPAEKKGAISAVPMHLARMVYLYNVKADGLIKERAIKEKHVTFHQGGKDFHDLLENFRKKERVLIPKTGQGKAGRDERRRNF
jgi:TRAP-type transport system periplasmic protein